jgi:hypothetical protein
MLIYNISSVGDYGIGASSYALLREILALLRIKLLGNLISDHVPKYVFKEDLQQHIIQVYEWRS